MVLSVPRTTDPPKTYLVILTWSYRKLLILDPPYAIKPIALLQKTLKTYQSRKIIIMIESSRSSKLVYVHVRELLLTSHGFYDLRTTERTWF